VELIQIGTKLSQQPDPDMPKTKILSGYLIDPERKIMRQQGKTGSQMRGVLLMVMFYLVLSKSAAQLKNLMGETKLSEYVKICNITLMFESFLNKEDFTIWELTMAEIILKKLIKDFVDYVKWQEGKGLKLIKIHLINQFVECI